MKGRNPLDFLFFAIKERESVGLSFFFMREKIIGANKEKTRSGSFCKLPNCSTILAEKFLTNILKNKGAST
jgi:hypothetical protein